MDKQVIEARIYQMIANYMAYDQSRIELSDNLVNNLGMDELDCLELFLMIENEFNIVIDEEYEDAIHTIQDLIECVDKILGDRV